MGKVTLNLKYKFFIRLKYLCGNNAISIEKIKKAITKVSDKNLYFIKFIFFLNMK